MLGDRSHDRRTTLRGVTGLVLAAAGLSGTTAGRADRSSNATTQQGRCDVSVPDDYDTIQDAIDDASNNDTVCVQPGTYDAVTIDVEGLTLRATDTHAAAIDGAGRGTTVAIDADGVTLEGFEIAGDGDTTSGVSIRTSEGATEDITIAENHIHGMAKPGGGNDPQLSSWGILAWGDTPLSEVTIEDNLIESIGHADTDDENSDSTSDEDDEKGGLPTGVGIDLEEVAGSRPGGGAVIRRNTITGMASATVRADDLVDIPFQIDGVSDASVDLPGVGISIQPLEESNSDAGDPATDLRQNEITDTWIDVVLGEAELTRVMD